MRLTVLLIVLAALFGGYTIPSAVISIAQFEEIEPEDSIQRALPVFLRQSPQWALEKLETLTLEEKIAQSFMVEVTPNKGENHLSIIDSLVTSHKIGGIIMFQGTVESTKSAIERFQTQSTLPLLVGIDGEWGSNMRLKDGERFPFQLTIGAANQLESTKTIARAIGQEMRELGIHINFSPVVDLNSNPKNPVIGFRAFGENPLTVSKNSLEMIKGMHEYNVLTSMKHFPGHGDTETDSHLGLPVVHKSKKELNRMEWLPYKQGRLIGASSIMVGHLSAPLLDSSGLPASISPTIIQGIIRNELKFDGLVISDALNMKALTNHYGDVDIVKRAYLAGNDILLYPSKVKESIEAIRLAVENGEISEEEVNRRTLRILRAKFYVLHPDEKKEFPVVTKEQIEYAKINVFEKALTLIKNENVVPIKNLEGKNLILNIGKDGSAFNEAFYLYGEADTLSYESAKDAKAILKFKFKNYDRIFINLIAPSVLPRNDFSYPDGWRELLRELPQEPEIFVSFFGNPYAVKDRFDFENVDAVLLGFQNSEIGQNRAAQLYFGGFQATSVLPITLSVDYQEGFGIQTIPPIRLKYTVPYELGVSDTIFSRIDTIMNNAIEKEAFPGGQIVIAKDGKVIYRKAFGYQTYEKQVPVNHQTVYDLASVTKIASSTVSLMYLQDHHQFALDSTLGYYLPALTEETAYKDLKMRDIMAHQAGLASWVPFYVKTLVNGKPDSTLYATSPVDNKTMVVAENLFLDKSYVDTIYKKIVSYPLKKKSYKYSDIGYYFVKDIIETSSSTSLDEFALNHFYKPMGLKTMGYNPLSRLNLIDIAPTEEDKYFRHQRIQGHVHDMGAAMLNGVGGHAGLFSNATDLAVLMQMLLNDGKYGGKTYLSKEVIKEYTDCQFCPKNRRGAGFDKPVVNDKGGPATEEASKQSYGHSGFTGTLTWADPKYNINYVFLSNRTYPDAENWKIVKMNIRTDIQKIIYQAFGINNAQAME